MAVGPAAHRIDRALDRLPILAARAMLVELVAALVSQPIEQPESVLVETLQPHLAPAIPHDGRIGRGGVDGKYRGAPSELVAEQATTHEMNVVAIAIVRRGDGDDSLERRRPARRPLQPVEPAPGDADHPDGARAPRLGDDPGDHLHGVVLFL